MPMPPVSGYIAWWDASQITGHANGASVTSWPDSSGNGYTLTTTTPPIYTTNVQNGLPAVNFVAGNVWLAGTWALTGTETFFVVSLNASGTGGTNQRILSSPTATEPDYTAGMIDYNTTAATYGVRIDQMFAPNTPDSTLDNVALGTECAPGGTAPDGSFFTGCICEILIYNSTLNDTQIASVTNYLTNKWIVASASGLTTLFAA
jgi:hypothetical protein